MASEPLDRHQAQIVYPWTLAQEWAWNDSDAPTSPLWPVLRSAADLLTSDELRLLRECAAETCTWLFLDRSRNHSRRWCAMQVCGHRAKARRHYRRKRAAATR